MTTATPASAASASNSTRYLVRGASLYGRERADLLIEDGRIAQVGSIADASGATVVDAEGLVALPGLVDVHTHLREPGREDAETVETGSRAAARGGYTAVHAMANSSPVADTAGVVEQVHSLGRRAGWVDVRPVGAVTVGLAGEQLAEIGAMANSAAQVRMFSDDGMCVHDPVLMRRALEYVKAFDGVVAQHAQEPRLTAGAQMNEGVVSAVLGAGFVWYAWKVLGMAADDRAMKPAKALFGYSLLYLFAIFAAYLVDCVVGRALLMGGV